MKCGECGAAVTAEEKYKYQKNGNVHHYIYYHCTKRIRPDCPQGSIEEKRLTNQIVQFLGTIEVSSDFTEWVIRNIAELVEDEHRDESAQLRLLTKRSQEVRGSLRELTKLRYTKLIDDTEFERERNGLRLELSRIDAAIQKNPTVPEWREAVSYVYNALADIQNRFLQGTAEEQRCVLSDVGSNLILKDRKLNIKAKEPFALIHKAYVDVLTALGPLEPLEKVSTAKPSPYLTVALNILWTSVSDVRTYLINEERKQKRKELGLPELSNETAEDAVPPEEDIAA